MRLESRFEIGKIRNTEVGAERLIEDGVGVAIRIIRSTREGVDRLFKTEIRVGRIRSRSSSFCSFDFAILKKSADTANPTLELKNCVSDVLEVYYSRWF